MNLNELAVGVERALLIERRLRRAGADHGIRGLAEDCANAAGGDDDGVGGEGAHLHGVQIHGADAAADRRCESSTAERNSQCSNFLTLPSDS